MQETRHIEGIGGKPANILYVVIAEDSQSQGGVKSGQARLFITVPKIVEKFFRPDLSGSLAETDYNKWFDVAHHLERSRKIVDKLANHMIWDSCDGIDSLKLTGTAKSRRGFV